jgi:hypothetical protein
MGRVENTVILDVSENTLDAIDTIIELEVETEGSKDSEEQRVVIRLNPKSTDTKIDFDYLY